MGFGHIGLAFDSSVAEHMRYLDILHLLCIFLFSVPFYLCLFIFMSPFLCEIFLGGILSINVILEPFFNLPFSVFFKYIAYLLFFFCDISTGS